MTRLLCRLRGEDEDGTSQHSSRARPVAIEARTALSGSLTQNSKRLEVEAVSILNLYIVHEALLRFLLLVFVVMT